MADTKIVEEQLTASEVSHSVRFERSAQRHGLDGRHFGPWEHIEIVNVPLDEEELEETQSEPPSQTETRTGAGTRARTGTRKLLLDRAKRLFSGAFQLAFALTCVGTVYSVTTPVLPYELPTIPEAVADLQLKLGQTCKTSADGQETVWVSWRPNIGPFQETCDAAVLK